MQVDVLKVAERLGIPFAIIIVFTWFGVKYAWPFVVTRMENSEKGLHTAQNALIDAHKKLVSMIKDQTKVNTETVACLEEISERLKSLESNQKVILEILRDMKGEDTKKRTTGAKR